MARQMPRKYVRPGEDFEVADAVLSVAKGKDLVLVSPEDWKTMVAVVSRFARAGELLPEERAALAALSPTRLVLEGAS